MGRLAVEQETQEETVEEEIKIPSQQLFDSIFNLSITTVRQVAQEKSIEMQLAKEYVANYLERIVNGLRDTSS
jgi:hypothetical protein